MDGKIKYGNSGLVICIEPVENFVLPEDDLDEQLAERANDPHVRKERFAQFPSVIEINNNNPFLQPLGGIISCHNCGLDIQPGEKYAAVPRSITPRKDTTMFGCDAICCCNACAVGYIQWNNQSRSRISERISLLSTFIARLTGNTPDFRPIASVPSWRDRMKFGGSMADSSLRKRLCDIDSSICMRDAAESGMIEAEEKICDSFW